MYAVIRSGGKQYRVAEGQTLKLEKLTADVGSEIDFNEVLMLVNGDDIKVGKPYIDGQKVVASVVSHGRGKKIHLLNLNVVSTI